MGHYLWQISYPIGTMCFPWRVEVALLTNRALTSTFVGVSILGGPVSSMTCAQGSRFFPMSYGVHTAKDPRFWQAAKTDSDTLARLYGLVMVCSCLFLGNEKLFVVRV